MQAQLDVAAPAARPPDERTGCRTSRSIAAHDARRYGNCIRAPHRADLDAVLIGPADRLSSRRVPGPAVDKRAAGFRRPGARVSGTGHAHLVSANGGSSGPPSLD